MKRLGRLPKRASAAPPSKDKLPLSSGSRVHVSGSPAPAATTKVRWPRRGGRYEGDRDVEFSRVTIDGVSFAGIEFTHFYADGTRFRDCDFTGSALHGTFGVRRRTVFERCVFDATRLSGVEPGQARFVACAFRAADLRGWNAAANDFVGCVFAGRLEECNFWAKPSAEWHDATSRRRNEFVGNDFTAAELIGVSFLGGIDLSAQRLPASPEYVWIDRLAERVAKARVTIGGWPDAARQHGLIMLDVLSSPGFDEQDELFAHRWDMGVPRDIADSVWALLEAGNVAPR